MPTETTRRRLLLAGLVAAAYASGVGALLAASSLDVTVSWWPAAGFGLLALLACQPRERPWTALLLLVAWAAANLTAGRPPLLSVLFALGNTAEAVVVLVLLLRWTGGRLRRLVDTWLLVVASAAGAVVAAAVVAVGYTVGLDRPFGPTALVIGPAHLASLVLLGPLGMLGDVRRGTAGRRGEVALHTGLLLLVAALAFGPGGDLLPGLGLLPLPLLVWAAARFEVRTVVLQLVGLAVVVSVGTAAGWGPFPVLGAANATTAGLVSQVYLICAALIALPLVQAMREREQALTRTAASERVFRRSFTESRVPVLLVHRRQGRLWVAEANPATARLLGRPAHELVGRGVEELLTSPGLDLDGAGGSSGAEGWSGDMGVVGQPRTRLEGILSLLDTAGEQASYSLHLIDLTQPLELQERLRAERTYTRAVIDTASSLIVVTDEHGTVIAANPATSQMTGYSAEDLVGRPIWETLVPAHQRLRFSELVAHLPSLPRSGETTVMTRDGEHRSVVFSNAVHTNGPGEPVTLVFSATDVTDARESAGLVRHLLRSATTMAFVGTDLDGRITLFNPGAERLLGLPAARAEGRLLTDFLQRVEAADADAPLTLTDLLAGGGSELAPETRDWLLLADGRSPLRISMTSNPVTTGRGTVFAYLFVAHDVTDTRRSQEILVNALRRERQVVARLRELDHAKDDFVSTVSHELRTPMSSIIGSAEMLLDGLVGDLDPAQQQLVEVVERNGARLLSLADDLLLLATSDAGGRTEQTQDLDLRDVVRESIASVDSALAGRRLETCWDLPDQPVPVSGEPSHLERAFTNLLTNAVKFTPDGGQVALRLRQAPEHRTALVEVTDTGLGIDAAELDQVFDRFYRSATVQEQAIQGTGLGLAIVRTIVEAHDGRIDVASTPGQGSTFGVTLPLRRTPSVRPG
ncbi:PAS domain S-box protein [Nocardioides aurantiacus]|uniref:histidine kinase n=1 Tax=Nocardioides aurantiacus TaxID=86796 RepID=A0A3N2CWT3_9ACTN|nr:PAS domain S-box protein [Nocardioides aurantiacus]ROR92000.1 hypothetical protein EDD33_2881 [Nocardioides aurantiacus]